MRQKEQDKAKQIPSFNTEFGEAQIHEEAEFYGYKAWKFSIAGMPQALDGGQLWLIDTKDVVRTGIGADDNTPEKAFMKQQETLATVQKQQPGS